MTTTDIFLKLLRELQKIDPEFPIQYAMCLAEISRHEGLSLSELAHKTHMPLSTVSRVIGALSDARQRGKPYHLAKVTICATERRRKNLSLTTKGKAVMQSIGEILGD
jgi:DNA-binding MarR family transcriptional regulator